MTTLSVPRRLRYIDSDVHPTIADAGSLYAYMTLGWRKRFEAQRFSLSDALLPSRYAHPTGNVTRADAVPPRGGFAGSDPDYLRTHYLDTFGPERVLLIPLQLASFVSWVDPDAVAQIFHATNEYFREHWLPRDERYMYSLLAVPHDPVQAAAEIRRLAPHKQISAIYLPLVNKLLGDRHYYPIYDAAMEAGLPVITHPTGQEGSYVGVPTLAGGIPSSYIERYCDLPQVAEANCSSLIFEGTFNRFPALKVIFVEWGFSWLMGLQWRMDKAWRGLRRETPWVARLPSEIIGEHLRFTTQPLDEPTDHDDFEHMLHAINAQKVLMFSTDYPHWDNDVPTRVFNRQSEELRKAIFFENGASVYARALA
ncbi:MAG: amidohydrolase family protein [Candidatus Velthaea sp.]